jgi:tRNA-splicing ligase RtcB
MSRSQAAGRFRWRKQVVDGKKVRVREQVKPGVVDWPAVQERLRSQGIVLVGGGADEAPEVYKRLPDVLDAHAGTIRVEHTLRPLGVAMAGGDVFDPYRD